MKKLRYILVILLAMVFAGSAFAQSREVKGVVTEPDGNAAIGASVMIPGTTTGTITDMDGAFSLSVPESTKTLEVSYIGFSNYTITLTSADTYKVILAEDTNFLDEVVVVGYGIQKKINVTGSVSSMSFDSENVKSRPMFNATQALSGTMPGLQVMQGSGNPYEENFNVLVRGTGTLNSSGPLVLVDGSIPAIGR